MVTHSDIVTILEPLVTACAKFGQNLVAAKVTSAILLILCSSVLY
jgi:hypothetical protein